MKRYLTSALLVLLVAFGTGSGCTVPSTKSPPVAAKPNFAGDYAGEWRGQDESTGALRIKLMSGPNSTWTGSVVFAFEAVDVPTTVNSVHVDGSKVEVVFTYEIDGTVASTKLVGEMAGNQLGGSYDSNTGGGGAAGTWKVTRLPPRA